MDSGRIGLSLGRMQSDGDGDGNGDRDEEDYGDWLEYESDCGSGGVFIFECRGGAGAGAGTVLRPRRGSDGADLPCRGGVPCDRRDDEGEAYYEEGGRFDQLVIDLLSAGRYGELDGIDPALVKAAAPEAELRPLYLISGATGGQPGKLLCYHGIKYSVGDLTMEFASAA